MNWTAYSSYAKASESYYAKMNHWDAADDWWQSVEFCFHMFAFVLGCVGWKSGMGLFKTINEGHD